MKDTSKKLFTTGEFAKKAGVTIRTLRYYDKIGLLVPSSHNELGHRLYSKEDFGKLQKILTLKFIGLSLEDIANIMKYDLNHKDFKKSLEIQKEIMKKKIKHIQSIIKAIDEAADTIDFNKEMDWDKFINIISAINSDKNWTQQYENASNLRARIAIHELFSTNKEGWMPWFFKELKQELSRLSSNCQNYNEKINNKSISELSNLDLKQSNIKILELGCGDASLWNKNFNHIPSNWDITLTDFSEGMLKDAKKNLREKRSRFNFKIVNAESIPFEEESFDVVIANHMLYHVPNINKALKEINRVLKSEGILFASTVGKNHMKEIREIISTFDIYSLTSESWEITDSFQLENGLKIVSEYFNMVELKRYKDNLKVTDPVYILDYIFSMPGNNKVNLSSKDLKKIYDYLEDNIKEKENIYITKDTGYFKGKK
ncbi:MerR family transcriptional regulator [Clostridium botulinum]|uniref:Transcriptional regulator, MerR family/methyltransferase, UbiE/COQ5 family n=1 Tax=Clostridium botulinum (strain Langeland / NCTC 10281 / Type F) TaxID=441772 RepID=A7GBM3_CLOBL|nr:MerR family transcriptional regulator [Clostridium botulinum]ABS41118.1 transcriptional regulator, MerR family/methyltransferase, UbiE/COQ5 family [Clostridium botulinum F str. Langeland]ADF98654.1 transcriptional regulator, MerR family/methyltransferase, UbiE/COQ5 family [Clostridium botulinum F str. 230613]KKM40065.1 MerR family transcriptional regulator [Clostridium botulinum]MBY6791918.1 methyltransferase domain-containing protein [Clostridium botulinum]MBY6935926.1 methyltransferase do